MDTKQVIDPKQAENALVKELNELQLALVGGGIGDAILG